MKTPTQSTKQATVKVPFYRTLVAGVAAQLALLMALSAIGNNLDMASTATPNDRPGYYIASEAIVAVLTLLTGFVVARPQLLGIQPLGKRLLLLLACIGLPLVLLVQIGSGFMYIDCGGPDYHCVDTIPRPALNDTANGIATGLMAGLLLGMAFYMYRAKAAQQWRWRWFNTLVVLACLAVGLAAYTFTFHQAKTFEAAQEARIQQAAREVVAPAQCRQTENKTTHDYNDNQFYVYQTYMCDQRLDKAQTKSELIASLSARGFHQVKGTYADFSMQKGSVQYDYSFGYLAASADNYPYLDTVGVSVSE